MKGTVYIVDDDAQVCQSTCFLLKSMDYECRSFPSGESFIGAIDGLPPGCVLLDLCMPGSNGLDVQLELARQGKNLPVVAMTGASDSALVESVMKMGAVNMLHKPFPPEALLQALQACFTRLEREFPKPGTC